MKKLIFLLFIISTQSFACQYSIIEQNGRFFLTNTLIGSAPSKHEKVDEELRQGLQEVTVSNKHTDKKEEARYRIIYQSDNRKEVEDMLKFRCAQ